MILQVITNENSFMKTYFKFISILRIKVNSFLTNIISHIAK